MSFESVFRLIIAGIFVLLGVSNLELSFSKAWLTSRGRAFARRNLAWVSDHLVSQFDALTQHRARGVGVLALVVATGVATIPLPAGDEDIEASFLAGCMAVFILGLLALHLWLLVAAAPAKGAPGLRVARSREVSRNDYVWPWSRASVLVLTVVAFGLAIVGLTASRKSGAGSGDPVLLGSLALAFLIGVLVADRAASRLVGTLEGAADEAHLYWRDAYRAETLDRLYGVCATGVLVMGATTGMGDDLGPWTLRVSSAMFVVMAGLASVHNRPGTHWFRKRLWPMLAPGQVLQPGQPLPEQVTA